MDNKRTTAAMQAAWKKFSKKLTDVRSKVGAALTQAEDQKTRNKLEDIKTKLEKL